MVKRLTEIPGSSVYVPAPTVELSRLQLNTDAQLPRGHIDFLRISNGAMGFHGYIRLFGIGSSKKIDSVVWNDPNCWKFAWQTACLDYWCFGETAWGDQYAYRYSEMRDNSQKVYFLEATTMAAEPVADSFEEFFEREFLRTSSQPYDDMILAAFDKFGPLPEEQHLVYMPPLVLSGAEKIEHVEKLDARAAMVINGDVHVQMDGLTHGAVVRGVHFYKDNTGKQRVKLLTQ